MIEQKKVAALLDKMHAVSAAPKNGKLTSRLENDSFNICPYCSSVMKITRVKGDPVYWCPEDRYVSPMPDDEAAQLKSSVNVFDTKSIFS